MSLESSLIKLAATGDGDAQRLVYESLKQTLHCLILRIVGPEDVDDVTQDSFLKIFSSLHSFSFGSSFSTWAHRVAVNESLQHLRRSKRRPAAQLDDTDMPSKAHEPITELQDLFHVAFERIDPELRAILHLKESNEASYAEIAEILGIPEGTVGSRLNRARRELKSQLLALGWEE